MFYHSFILNEALKDGTVIRFKIPLLSHISKKNRYIDTQPTVNHYAVVIGKTGSIRNNDFNGHDIIKMHHYDGNNHPEAPYLSRGSFEPGTYDSAVIDDFFKSYPYSRPNEKPGECAICSIHDDLDLANLAGSDFTVVGKLKGPVYKKFEAYYKKNKDRMHHLLIDKKGVPYYVIDPYRKNSRTTAYLKDANWRTVDRRSIQEAFGYQNLRELLLLPSPADNPASLTSSSQYEDDGLSEPWLEDEEFLDWLDDDYI